MELRKGMWSFLPPEPEAASASLDITTPAQQKHRSIGHPKGEWRGQPTQVSKRLVDHRAFLQTVTGSACNKGGSLRPSPAHSLAPRSPVFFCRSLPARSTRCIWARRCFFLPSSNIFCSERGMGRHARQPLTLLLGRTGTHELSNPANTFTIPSPFCLCPCLAALTHLRELDSEHSVTPGRHGVHIGRPYSPRLRPKVEQTLHLLRRNGVHPCTRTVNKSALASKLLATLSVSPGM